ncbi:MAG: S1 RNA-binding domain-containing protein, partial [Acidobacteria bacterium]|nr:S1 RNA-binding domain-containing protein [Acidobacteriota bacterium]
KIQECQDKNVVVSHRALLEEERDRELEQVKAQIQPGARLTGQVVKMESFGAFIDFGARVQGLLHVSECAHQRVNHPQDLFQIGQELEVLVQSVELDARGRDRISLSRKALLPDPWNELNLEKDQVRKGVITRKVDFGWFVELAPGIEGLIPGRYLRSAGQKLEEAEFNEGQELEVVVVDFDSRQRQITLAIPGWDEKPASALKPGDTVKAKVVKIIPAGVLIQALEDPARGLIPKHTLQGATFKSLEKQFPIDGEIQAVLEAIDEQGRYNFRIRGDEEFVDDKTIQQYVSSDADMKHNPFAAFFKKD